MASITIRNLQDAAKRRLRIRAAKAGVSLEAYVRHILVAASRAEEADAPDILQCADACFGTDNGIELELPTRGTHRPDVEFSP